VPGKGDRTPYDLLSLAMTGQVSPYPVRSSNAVSIQKKENITLGNAQRNIALHGRVGAATGGNKAHDIILDNQAWLIHSHHQYLRSRKIERLVLKGIKRAVNDR
jgi:hypothetical protein